MFYGNKLTWTCEWTKDICVCKAKIILCTNTYEWVSKDEIILGIYISCNNFDTEKWYIYSCALFDFDEKWRDTNSTFLTFKKPTISRFVLLKKWDKKCLSTYINNVYMEKTQTLMFSFFKEVVIIIIIIMIIIII